MVSPAGHYPIGHSSSKPLVPQAQSQAVCSWRMKEGPFKTFHSDFFGVSATTRSPILIVGTDPEETSHSSEKVLKKFLASCFKKPLSPVALLRGETQFQAKHRTEKEVRDSESRNVGPTTFHSNPTSWMRSLGNLLLSL